MNWTMDGIPLAVQLMRWRPQDHFGLSDIYSETGPPFPQGHRSSRKLTEAHGSSRKFRGRHGSARKFRGPLTEVTPPLARKLTEAHGSSRKFGWLPGPSLGPSPRPHPKSPNVAHFQGKSPKNTKNLEISRGAKSSEKLTEKQSRNVLPPNPNPLPVIPK